MEMPVVAAAVLDGVGDVGDRSLEPMIVWGSMQALTLPVELVTRGDVVAVGQRFYRVDSVVHTEDRFGFPLIVLRSLETGARAAIEFRNADAPVSVLRFPTEYEPAGASRGETASPAAPATAPGSDVSREWRPASGIRLTEAFE